MFWLPLVAGYEQTRAATKTRTVREEIGEGQSLQLKDFTAACLSVVFPNRCTYNARSDTSKSGCSLVVVKLQTSTSGFVQGINLPTLLPWTPFAELNLSDPCLCLSPLDDSLV